MTLLSEVLGKVILLIYYICPRLARRFASTLLQITFVSLDLRDGSGSRVLWLSLPEIFKWVPCEMMFLGERTTTLIDILFFSLFFIEFSHFE